MARITNKQVDSINAKCTNGFHIDMEYFVERGKKQLVKIITLVQETKQIVVTLYWPQPKIKQGHKELIPTLHCAVWHRRSAYIWTKYGLGAFHEFKDHPSAKKLMTELCKVTELVTDELVSSMLPVSERQEFRKIVGLPEE